MYLRLDPHSGEPIWRQLVEQIKYRVASGQLHDGDKLPSIRGLAKDLKINPRTVVKAYEELQHAGLVLMRHGKGVFITHTRTETPASTRQEVLSELARRLFAEASRMGADPDEVIHIIQNVAEEMGDHERRSD